MKHVYVVGTFDTKAEELRFVADTIRSANVPVLTVDVGTRAASVEVDFPATVVAGFHPGGGTAVFTQDRGRSVAAMGDAFERFLSSRKDIAGVLGLGGGGGTSIVAAGLRQLPYGVPKIIVSTLAGGDISAFVGISDIVMMPAVTDFAGLNQISRRVLTNAAHAMVGMVTLPEPLTSDKPAVGLTMFGVTTPVVTAVAERLRDRFDCLVFHATGTGGRTMEKLVDSHLLSAVIDITTTEVCDLLCGGVLPATDDRFGAVARASVPYVGSVGALDMVNFWAPETVPKRFDGRTFYRHNPNVTLMRTTTEECWAIGHWIGERLSASQGPVRILIPERGVSALDIEGGPFFDPEADAALFDALEAALQPSPQRRIERLPLHINDPAFAEAIVSTFNEIVPR